MSKFGVITLIDAENDMDRLRDYLRRLSYEEPENYTPDEDELSKLAKELAAKCSNLRSRLLCS